MNRPDVPSLVSGLALIGFGAVLLLDQLDALTLGFRALAPIACAVVGGTLLALGLSRRD